MPLMFIFVVGIAVALVRRRLLAVPGGTTRSGDAPARLLGWAVGLLAAPRNEWGQAMIGELDRLDGPSRRWRFALGCVGAALVMPPWGATAAALGILMAVAAAGGGLTAYAHIHYGLSTDGWTWLWTVVIAMILAGYILGGGALLRRPGVAGPGLVGGLLLAAAELAVGGFTFTRFLNSLWSHWWLLFVVPAAVGVGGALWSGNAVAGRRIARLAAISANLAVYLYGVLAVAVIGASGHPSDDGMTKAAVISDQLGTEVVFYLLAMPLMTATIGWAAAAGTERLRRARPALAPAQPAVLAPDPGPTAGALAVPGPSQPPTGAHPMSVRPHPGAPATQRRVWYVLLLCAALAVSAMLALLAQLRS